LSVGSCVAGMSVSMEAIFFTVVTLSSKSSWIDISCLSVSCDSCGSMKRGSFWVRLKTGRVGIGIMCPNGAICLPADCCFS
jgi:hypothetical protein